MGGGGGRGQTDTPGGETDDERWRRQAAKQKKIANQRAWGRKRGGKGRGVRGGAGVTRARKRRW